MSFFDKVTGLLQGGELGKYQTVLNWINDQGGIQALLDKFHQQGFSAMVTSWLNSETTNHPIDASQIEAVLGSPAISQLAGKLGIDPHEASAMLAQYLLGIIDALSPNGQLQTGSHSELMTKGLELLKGKFFS